MSTFYEVALVGEFFQADFQAILNRFTLNSESAQKMHSYEVIFEPGDAAAQRALNVIPIQLRCRKELLGNHTGWVMFSHLKPETARIQGASEATIRPAVVSHVTGDALRFASALGYRKSLQLYKRGYIFRRGPISIQVFQMDNIDPKTQKPLPAHADSPWQVEVKTAPMRNTQETPLTYMVDAVLEVQRLMKGILDLQKLDA
ncbi:hypothetical protein BU17DRAFT_73103 [Hysterangium stoloniferum]|nr:hypothetical protein BU17DRAFT_73103 [Hysterangium stoloniferum]